MAENNDNLHLNFYSSAPSGRRSRLKPSAAGRRHEARAEISRRCLPI
jgi:hypothetical protein